MNEKLETILDDLKELNIENLERVIDGIVYDDYNEYLDQLYIMYRFIALKQHYELIDCIVNRIYNIVDKATKKDSLAKGYSIIIAFSTLNDLPEKAVEYGLKFEEIRDDLPDNAPYIIPVYSSLAAIFYRNNFYNEAIEYIEKLLTEQVFEQYPNPVKASQYMNYISMELYVKNTELYEIMKKKLNNIFENDLSDDVKSLKGIYKLNLIQNRNKKAIEENNEEELKKVMEDFIKIDQFDYNSISYLVQQQDIYLDILKTFFRFEKYQYVIERCNALISIPKTNDVDLMEAYKLLISSLERINGEASVQIIKKYNAVLSRYYNTQVKMKRQMIEKSIELYNLEKRIQNIIRIDPLTNCYNRRYLDEFVKDNKHVNSVIYIDIDHFKRVNDKYGHKQGDMLLVNLTEAVNCYLPKNSALFRMGGDEFVIISSLSSIEENEDILLLMKNKWIERIRTVDNIIKTDFSYGIYIVDKNKPCTIYEMIDYADELMYINKVQKKKNILNTKSLK